jgi:hypothetical protein
MLKMRWVSLVTESHVVCQQNQQNQPHMQNPQAAAVTPCSALFAVCDSVSQIAKHAHARTPPARGSAVWLRLRLVPLARRVPAARCASPHALRAAALREPLRLGVLGVRSRHPPRVTCSKFRHMRLADSRQCAIGPFSSNRPRRHPHPRLWCACAVYPTSLCSLAPRRACRSSPPRGRLTG